MDIVTHGLASLAVARALFPRAGKLGIASAVLAGCLADLDRAARYFGPAAAVTWRFTYFHSVLAAIFFPVVLIIFPAFWAAAPMGSGAVLVGLGKLRDGEAIPEDPGAARRFVLGRVVLYFFAAPACAALLHIAMDACQSDGVMLLWPLRTKRFAADWLPSIDPWILTILIAAIALPELFHLVNAEIGSRSKKPRGRTGAILGLALVFAYIGARGMLHTNAVALMESRTFHGEAARRASAYPESLSLITWHGIAETESALNEIDVSVFAAATFDADTSVRIYKPQPSPALEAARNTRAAQQFLAIAQVPKASVEKTDVGSVVILRDMRYVAAGETQREIAALIELDPENKVTSQELVWARDLRN